ncbi:adhesion G-protein coupled receptor D1-like [Pocillopora verrucosa]|uniref:adhesion G-protein coupled receptor D1-like n=1 Tax=Pocillopora verrucosa TaxID=203993 RepID=UPI00333F46D7
MMAAMDPKPEKLQENVILKFRNLKNHRSEKHCMFWSGLRNSQDGFSKDGCHIVTSQSNSEETVCSCNHLTHFAVLVDYRSDSVLSQKDEDILEIITYLGLSLSIIGMILTIIMYSLFADVHQPLPQIRLSLAASLGAGQISFFAGMHAMDNPAICITAAVLTQYFLMAAFCWMLVEGIYFYLFIVKVYNISNRLIVYHVMAWGFPLIMVITSLSIAIGKGGIQSYTSTKYCWLSSTYDLIWIFVAFLTATGVLGSFILARVTRELTTLPQTGVDKIQRVRLGIRTCVLMIPLLGITWLFGLLSPLHKAFTYIFTILNSTQGVLIFILHCMRNSQIRERLRGKIKILKIGQIRARMKVRMNAVSPSPNNRNSTKKNVKMNPTDGGAVWATKLHPFSEYELK